MASDKPLALVDCQFEHLSFHIQPDTLMRLRQSLFGHWDSYAIAGAMSHCGLGTMLGGGAEAGAEAGASLREALRQGLRNHRPLSERALEGNARGQHYPLLGMLQILFTSERLLFADSYDVRRARQDEREAAKAAGA